MRAGVRALTALKDIFFDYYSCCEKNRSRPRLPKSQCELFRLKSYINVPYFFRGIDKYACLKQISNVKVMCFVVDFDLKFPPSQRLTVTHRAIKSAIL